MVQTLKGPFSHLNDGLYNSPGIEVVNEDGVAFLARGGGPYDLVMFSRVRDVPSFRSYLLSESRLYTLEGLHSATNVLNPNGTIAALVTNFPNHRPFNVLATLRRLAIDQFPEEPWQDRVRVVRLSRFKGEPILFESFLLLFSPNPTIMRTLDSVSVPSEEVDTFAKIHDPLTMDRPFINAHPIDHVPEELQTLLALAVTFVFVFLVAAGRALRVRVQSRHKALALLLVFLIMGIWSMTCQGLYLAKACELVGVSLAAKTTVIAAFLLFGGLGSLLAPHAIPHLPFLIALLPVYNVFLVKALPSYITPTLPLGAQLTVLALGLLPLALVNGMVFAGTLLVARRSEHSVDVPWGYAADASGAVVGVFLAVALPIRYGYTVATLTFPILALVPAAVLFRLVRDSGVAGR